MSGRVFVISGPSGVGKSTIINATLAADPTLRLSVSCTTRAPRDGEADGRDYYFVNRTEFEARIADQAFLEWARVYDNYYGTSRAEVQRILDAGHHAVLDLDTQGARQIQAACHGASYIMIVPPSLEVLAARLRERGSESDHTFAQRMARAEHELGHREIYDHEVVNDQIEAAIARFREVIDAEKARHVTFECPS